MAEKNEVMSIFKILGVQDFRGSLKSRCRMSYRSCSQWRP